MEYLDHMSTNQTQQVILSLRTVAEQYLSVDFISYLFESNYLNLDWAGDNDPDEMPDEKLPPANISADKIHDAMGDFWQHYGGISLYYIYKQLDKDMKENADIIKYVYNEAEHDIANLVVGQCQTGKVYQTDRPAPTMISVFTGTKNKKIVDYSELYTSASDEIEPEEYIAFQEKADAL